jgi:peptidoglycan hydrolase-like protein with peptidoglycan-binding domain
LLNNPDLAATRESAIKVSLWFWMKNVHGIAPEDIDRATEIINVGKEGMQQRRKYFADWQDRLTPEVMEGLALGEVRLPVEQSMASREIKKNIDHGINGVLRTGDRNAAVGNLQTHLNSLGYTGMQGRALMIDQHFGRDTRHAVEAFQRNQHLDIDGVVGPDTWAALLEATRAASVAPVATPTAMPSATTLPAITFPQIAPPADLDVPAICALQQHLNTLHVADRHQALPVTGVYDDLTRNAVMTFQQSQGLPGSGLADAATRGLIEARATIVELQQHANRYATSQHEAWLPEAFVHGPGTSSVKGQAQPLHEPAPHATHSSPVVNAAHREVNITRQKDQGLSETARADPRHADHPLNALYNELKTRIPAASARRLLQFTDACYSHHITAESLGHIDFNQENGIIRFSPSWPPGPVATLDLKEPAPEPHQSMANIQQFDQQQAQMHAEFRAHMALVNAQAMQGPVLGGPPR